MLADLCKLEEETAAAAAVGDKKPPVPAPGESEQQMSGEEFASFMESLQQSKNIIHDPISLAIYDTVKLNQANQQTPSKPQASPEQQGPQKNEKPKNKPGPLPYTPHLGVQRPPSLSTPLSPSHVSIHAVANNC